MSEPLPKWSPEAMKAAREKAGDTPAQAAAVVHWDRTNWWRCETAKATMPLHRWELYLIKRRLRTDW